MGGSPARVKASLVKALGETPLMAGGSSQASVPYRKKAYPFCSWCLRFEGLGGFISPWMVQVADTSTVLVFIGATFSLVNSL